MTQTAGRAARNVDGRVIMYADNITGSMQRTIEETERRRKKQQGYNSLHNIIPRQIVKQVRNVLGRARDYQAEEQEQNPLLLDPVMAKFNPGQLQKAIHAAKLQMESAAADLDFMRAAKFRDEMQALKKLAEKI